MSPSGGSKSWTSKKSVGCVRGTRKSGEVFLSLCSSFNMQNWLSQGKFYKVSGYNTQLIVSFPSLQ